MNSMQIFCKSKKSICHIIAKIGRIIFIKEAKYIGKENISRMQNLRYAKFAIFRKVRIYVPFVFNIFL